MINFKQKCPLYLQKDFEIMKKQIGFFMTIKEVINLYLLSAGLFLWPVKFQVHANSTWF